MTHLSPSLQLILLLAIILAVAKTAGYLSLRLHQPSVLGELLAGLIIGPSLLNILHWPIFSTPLEETIHQLSELGVLLLMFVAGLELHLPELIHSSKVSILAGSFGVLLPVGLGYGTGRLFNLDHTQAIFLGLTLGATSVSISAQTLMELKVLRSRVGLGMLGAAVFDDVMIILFLSLILAVGTGEGTLASVVWVFIKMALFFVLSVVLGLWILPLLARKIARLPISQGVLSFALIILCIYGVAAELLGGMAAITGTFLAGLMFGRSSERESIQRGMNVLAYGLFVPIFFVSIGLSVDVLSLGASVVWLMIAIILVAVLGKLLGAGLGARLSGFSWLESAQLGAGMVSRGEVGLILASVGVTEGLMKQDDFSAVVAMVLFTTIITPLSLRALFSLDARMKRLHRTQSASEEVS